MTGPPLKPRLCPLWTLARRRHWELCCSEKPRVRGGDGLLQRSTLALVPLLALVIGTLVVALFFMPRDSGGSRPRRAAPGPPGQAGRDDRDRVLLTGSPTTLGPSLTGFWRRTPSTRHPGGVAHHLDGPGPAIRVLRGLLLGSSPSPLLLRPGVSIERVGIAQSFAPPSRPRWYYSSERSGSCARIHALDLGDRPASSWHLARGTPRRRAA